MLLKEQGEEYESVHGGKGRKRYCNLITVSKIYSGLCLVSCFSLVAHSEATASAVTMAII